MSDYLTVAELLRELMTADDSAAPNAVDDTVLAGCASDGSRAIDQYCNRQFFASAGTITLDAPVPAERRLWFGQDVLAVQSASNGDGSSVPASLWYLWPPNAVSYAAIVMKQSANVFWGAGSAGDTEGAITLAASLGYVDRAASDPKSVQIVSNTHRAALLKAAMLYRARTGQKQAGSDSDWQSLVDGYIRHAY